MNKSTLPESEIAKEIQQLVDRRCPKLLAKCRRGFSPVGRPDVKSAYIDVHSTVDVSWQDSEDLPSVIEPRTVDALKQLSKLLFESVQSQLDPEFMIAACPALRTWILREGIKLP